MELDLSDADVADRGLCALAASPHLLQLRELRGVAAGAAGLAALLRRPAPWWAVHLQLDPVDPALAEVAANAGQVPALLSLDLTRSTVDAGSLCSLLRSPLAAA